MLFFGGFLIRGVVLFISIYSLSAFAGDCVDPLIELIASKNLGRSVYEFSVASTKYANYPDEAASEMLKDSLGTALRDFRKNLNLPHLEAQDLIRLAPHFSDSPKVASTEKPAETIEPVQVKRTGISTSETSRHSARSLAYEPRGEFASKVKPLGSLPIGETPTQVISVNERLFSPITWNGEGSTLSVVNNSTGKLTIIRIKGVGADGKYTLEKVTADLGDKSMTAPYITPEGNIFVGTESGKLMAFRTDMIYGKIEKTDEVELPRRNNKVSFSFAEGKDHALGVRTNEDVHLLNLSPEGKIETKLIQKPFRLSDTDNQDELVHFGWDENGALSFGSTTHFAVTKVGNSEVSSFQEPLPKGQLWSKQTLGPNGLMAAVAGNSSFLTVGKVDTNTGTIPQAKEHPLQTEALNQVTYSTPHWNTDGTKLALASNQSQVLIASIHPQTGEIIRTELLGKASVLKKGTPEVAWGPGNTLLVNYQDDVVGTVKIYRIQAKIQEISTRALTIAGITWGPDGQFAIVEPGNKFSIHKLEELSNGEVK